MYKRNENEIEKAAISIACGALVLVSEKLCKMAYEHIYPFAVAKRTENKMKRCYSQKSIDIDGLTHLIEKERTFVKCKTDQIVREQLNSYLDEIEMNLNLESLEDLNDYIEKYSLLKQMAIIR